MGRRRNAIGCLVVGLAVMLLAIMAQPREQTVVPTRAVLPSITVIAEQPTDAPSATNTRTTTPNLAQTEAWLSGEATRDALNGVAQATNAALTLPPTAAARDSEIQTYANSIADGLFLLAGGRNVEQVSVSDGRRNGGERVIIVSYLTTETNEVGYVEEWIDLFSAIAATIRADDMDVDSVMLLAGTPTAQAVGTLTTSVTDLLAFHRGEISRATFLGRLHVTDF